MHLGNARTALVAWLAARKAGGTLIWRTEDLDEARAQPGLADEMMVDVRWLGMDWDEGPDVGGTYGPYVQSHRRDHYRASLSRLKEGGHLYPCRVSRRELADVATAPHGRSPVFPAHLRPTRIEADWWQEVVSGTSDAAVRLRVEHCEEHFHDLVAGYCVEDVASQVGDFVLLRRDGVFAYQLAVVTDDIAMNVTDVVRGADLINSTGRQIRLCRLLGGSPIRYAHVPLVCDHSGEKLSKRQRQLGIATLRENHVEPNAIIGYLAYSLGLIPEPLSIEARQLVAGFSWDQIRPEPWFLPDQGVFQA